MLKVFTMGLVLVSITACAMQRHRTPTQDETKVLLKDQLGQSKEAPAEASTNGLKEITRISPDDTEGETQSQATEMKEAVAAAAQHIQSTHGADKTARHAGPVPAEKAQGWLKNGNTRFVKGFLRNDGASSKDRLRLAAGQKPHSVILSCSDSRVPPELVFDQKLGEVFVIRTAGEALDNNVIGSIEYAVEHLGSNLVVVMGHESCGAVNAALASLKGSPMGSPALEALVADIKPRVQKYANTTPSHGLLEETWSNVDGVSKDLLERSAILRDAVASGDVKIVKALYHYDSGLVEWR